MVFGYNYFILYCFIYLSIIMYFYYFNFMVIEHPMICSFVILGENMLKELVSDEDAACAAGVIGFFIHYCLRMRLEYREI